MSSAKSPSEPGHVEETPRVNTGRTALRCGVGRYTVDILPDLDDDGVQLVVSNGQLGTGPATGRVGVEIVAVVVATAGFVRAVDVAATPAWVRVEA